MTDEIYNVDDQCAKMMASLYDAIVNCNDSTDKNFNHITNVFFYRLIFCLFGEDMGVFKKSGSFSASLRKNASPIVNDLKDYLSGMFLSFRCKSASRDNLYPKLQSDTHYLFDEREELPNLCQVCRKIITDCSRLDWSEINPDIFGSMMQAAVSQTDRRNLGQHYTSKLNILKCLNPLFLNKLDAEVREASSICDSEQKRLRLLDLLKKIREIAVFDPACGSGNFLIIAYESLRTLELLVMKELGENISAKSGISLGNFFGIEIDFLPAKLVHLGLYVKRLQMNYDDSSAKSELSFAEEATVVVGNSLRIDWRKVCPTANDKVTYIVGNPPFRGESFQSKEQKEDMQLIFRSTGMDYVCCWFKKAADYIRQDQKMEFIFVSTSSISQGQTIHRFWPRVLDNTGLEIHIAYLPFRWQNQAKGSAGVICNIIGMRHESTEPKYIYDKNALSKKVEYVAPSLADYRAPQDMKRQKPISNIPEIMSGAAFKEGGNLIIDGLHEKERIIRECPEAEKFIKKYMSGEDLLYHKLRYCLWIPDQDLEEARSISWINERLDKVSEFRRNASGRDISKLVDQPNKPTRFGGGVATHNTMIFPCASSHRRSYLPCDFVEPDMTIVTHGCFTMHDAPLHMLAIISSRMHMIWLQEFCGRMGEGLTYSSTMVYNTFPLPDLDKKENLIAKESLARISTEIISLRKGYYERGETLASLYGDGMPSDLLKLHLQADKAIESLYKDEPFLDDDERLKAMIKLYESMIEEEKAKEAQPFLDMKCPIGRRVDYISPNLKEYEAPEDVKRQKPISNIPEIRKGTQLMDGGNLIIDDFYQKEQIIRECPQAKKFIKKYMSGEDLLYHKFRYCLWIADQDLEEARSISWINERLHKVSEFRRNASSPDTAKFIDQPNKPTRFRGGVATHNSMIFPVVSSHRRSYLPCDFVEPDMTIVTNACFTMHNAPIHMLAIISSRMHIIWLQEFCGRMVEGLRYSSTTVYNTFPLPDLDKKENLIAKESLARISTEIISLRKGYYERGETLVSLYGDSMPSDLLKLHLQADHIIESLYQGETFLNDTQRLEVMIKLYKRMIKEEKAKEAQPFLDMQYPVGRRVDYISPSLKEYEAPEDMKRQKSISNVPEITCGTSLKDGGNLIIDGLHEKERIIRECPEAEKFIKKYMSGEDLLYHKLRYCLWIADQDLEEARSISWINERLDKVSEFRRNAGGREIAKFVDQPNKPARSGRGGVTCNAMIFSRTSSHRRSYLPCDFVERDIRIVTSSCLIIHDAPLRMLAIISSRMHMIWLQEFCGRLKEDLAYSSTMIYNTFPLPDLDKKENLLVKESLETISTEIISLRKGYYERGETLASLYGDEMPGDLLKLHLQVDRAIESLYKDEPFSDDDERLKVMIKLHDYMIQNDKSQPYQISLF